MSLMVNSKVNYKDFIKMEPTFLSLDISVRSTGWVLCLDGNVQYGTYSIESQDELGRRREFREFLVSLIGDKVIPLVVVEDVIAGTNFKTTKGLIQLNSIIDDLKEYNLVSVGEIKRIDNKKWKKYLKQASNYEGEIKKEEDKVLIHNCMVELGFNENVKQDIYDALGMAVAVIFRDKVLGEMSKTDAVLKKDLKRGYTIKQFEDIGVKTDKYLEKLVKKYPDRQIESVDWTKEVRDVLYLFKQKIVRDDKDDNIYIIKVNNMKLGVLALTKKLNTDTPYSYLMITKTK